MKLKILSAAVALVATFGLFSCDEDTALIGQSVMPQKDIITTAQDTFYVKTSSVSVTSVVANTSTSLLGSMIDPDTRAVTSAGFLAQFHVLEDMKFPKKTDLVWDTDGLPQIDSVYMYMYIDRFYGDSLRTMKLLVQELDTAKLMKEGTSYYTDLNPADYLTSGVGVQSSATYSVHDEALTSNIASGTSYHYVKVPLPISFGKRVLSKYYENADYLQSSQKFLRHVSAGFYFSTQGSVGSIVTVPFTTLNIHFKYNVDGKTSSVFTQLATTEEVLQNTSVSSKIPASMLAATNDYTYVKSPAGIFTEGELDVDEILSGHTTDSINNARLVIRRYNNDAANANAFEPTASLLLIAKGEMKAFFETSKLPNSRTSFLATLSNGNYTFSNISALISNMRIQRDRGAGITSTDTEAQKQAKYAAWEAANADWNKFLLIPVTTEYTTDSRTNAKVLSRLRHNMGLTSVKLEGGAGQGLELNVMYSSFNN